MIFNKNIKSIKKNEVTRRAGFGTKIVENSRFYAGLRAFEAFRNLPLSTTLLGTIGHNKVTN